MNGIESVPSHPKVVPSSATSSRKVWTPKTTVLQPPRTTPVVQPLKTTLWQTRRGFRLHPEGAEDGKKQWQFLATAADAGLLPPQSQPELQQRTQTENDTRGLLPLPQPHGSNMRSWRRHGGRFRFRMLFLLFLVSAVACFLWLGAPSFMSGKLDKERDEDDDDTLQVFPLVYKYGGGAGAGGNLSVTNSMTEFLLKRDLSRNEQRNVQGMKGFVRSFRSVTKPGDVTAILPIRGGMYPDGLYYTTLHIGDPPRPYYVDVDTGSDLTWLQCDAPCTTCAQGPHPWYSPKPKGVILSCKDPRCAEISREGALECQGIAHQCDYSMHYVDSSSSMGVLVADVLTIRLRKQNTTRTSIAFGCGYDQKGDLAQSPAMADGIIGLSSSRISLPSQLARRNLLKNVVGHCLAGEGGGYMFFGDDNFLPSTGMTWVPMLGKPAERYYLAELAKIYYGTAPAGHWTSPVVFDSGATFSFLRPELYKAVVASVTKSLLQTELKGYVDELDDSHPLCWKGLALSKLEDAGKYFKPLTFSFGGRWGPLNAKFMTVSPESYLYISDHGDFCLGIFESRYNLGNIIGDTILRGQLVVYDNEQNRIGWIRSKCVK